MARSIESKERIGGRWARGYVDERLDNFGAVGVTKRDIELLATLCVVFDVNEQLIFSRCHVGGVYSCAMVQGAEATGFANVCVF